jgi:hypothetical protein
MPRLSNRAYQILAAEVRRLCPNPLEEVRANIVLKRLHRFRQAEGKPITLEEMRQAVSDIFPDFDEAVLQKAARANGAAVVRSRLGCAGLAAGGLAALAGTVWVLNLPYPMIRWPVARVAPIVLLPSFISMDHHYRQAIALVEQSDQLINNATSAQDIELGADKNNQAQQHLDHLPVWFLGYYPQAYCRFFGCAWRFTYDEFQSARQLIGRNEAVIFQEENALKLLTDGTTAVETAKQTYQSAESSSQQTAAIAEWQAAMDRLTEIPDQTLAGQMADTKLAAYQRDYEQVTGTLSGSDRTNTRIVAAQSFATQAAATVANPPHDADTWETALTLWDRAIQSLEQVPLEDPGYATAQTLLATYIKNQGEIKHRLTQEQTSAEALAAAKAANVELVRRANTASINQTASQIQAVINQLEQVQPGTTAYPEAQELLRYAEEKLKQLNP